MGMELQLDGLRLPKRRSRLQPQNGADYSGADRMMMMIMIMMMTIINLMIPGVGAVQESDIDGEVGS